MKCTLKAQSNSSFKFGLIHQNTNVIKADFDVNSCPQRLELLIHTWKDK